VTAPGAISRFAAAWVERVVRWPGLVLVACVVLTGGLAQYTATHIGINTDTADMISPEVPWRKRFNAYRGEFPELDNTLVVVVDALTPEQAQRSAEMLATRLAQRPEVRSARLPLRDPFVLRHALLLMPNSEREALGARLIEAQPLLGRLGAQPTVAGLLELVEALVESDRPDALADLGALFNELSGAFESTGKSVSGAIGPDVIEQRVIGQGAPNAGAVSWQRILAGDSAPRAQQILLVKADLDYSELLPAGPLMDTVRTLARSDDVAVSGVRVRITGGAAMAHEELDTVSSGMGLSAGLALVLVTVVLLFGLQCWRTAIAVAVCLAMGLVWTAAFAAWSVGDLNLISVAFALLYIGLGVDYAVHYCLRYGELFRQGFEDKEAARIAASDVGASLVLCAITTGVGFAAFIPTEFSGVSELGIISGAGMFISLAASLTALPALLLVTRARPGGTASVPAANEPDPGKSDLGKPDPRKPDLSKFDLSKSDLGESDRNGHGPSGFSPNRRVVLVGVVVVVAVCAFALPGARFDPNPINLRDGATESVATYLELAARSNSAGLSLSVIGSPERLAHVRARLEQLPEVSAVSGLHTLVPDEQDRRLAAVDDLALTLGGGFELDKTIEPTPAGALVRALATTRQALEKSATDNAELTRLVSAMAQFAKRLDATDKAEQLAGALHQRVLGNLPMLYRDLNALMAAQAIAVHKLPAHLRALWIGNAGRHRLAVEPSANVVDNAAALAFLTAVQQVVPEATGTIEVNVRAGEVVVGAFTQALITAVVMIGLLLWFLLRKARDVAAVLTPLILAGLATAAAMSVLDIPFNFANVIALPLLLGIGVDNGIHLVHRMRFAPPRDGNLLASTTARALVLSALTTLCGFGNLAWSPHPGTASMGLVLSIGLAFAVMAALVVTPALIVKNVGARSR
jgi:hopanoid biosynthesis associated RND transporter like protein HpnN